MSSGDFCKQWHNDLPIAILTYSTTYDTKTGCEHSRIFYCWKAYNILDHKLGLKVTTGLVQTTDDADDLSRRTPVLYDRTKKIVMRSNIRYNKTYDKKVKASALQDNDYCYILQPKAHHTKDENTNSRL